MDFEQVMKQMKSEHEAALKEMPLPLGVEDYFRARVADGDADTTLFMLKLAWVFGAQAGQAAAAQAEQVMKQPQRRMQA